MSIDWEELLGVANSEDIESAWEESVYRAIEIEEDLNSENPYVTGNWYGENIRIKKSWGGHIFSEQELIDLFNGKSIKFRHTLKSNEEQDIVGKLARMEYKGTKYIGFQPNWN